MPLLTYYWRGSTAGNINSLSWDTLTNWRVLVLGTGNTSGYLTAATRLPLGGDLVNFGRQYLTSSASYLPHPAQNATVLSPCLFGGVSASNGWWSGATAGSSVGEKHGSISVTVNPSYPFSKLGGQVDEQILDEWAGNLVSQFHGGVAGGTGVGGWTRDSGTEYVDAQFVSTWYGATVGISFAQQPSGFSGAYSIRHRGFWGDMSKFGTHTTITGVTGASAGATGQAYDGSQNTIHIRSDGIPALGTLNNVSTFSWSGFSYATPTTVGDVYRHGSMQVSGHYNSVQYASCVRDANLSLVNARVNAVLARPTYANLGTTGANSGFGAVTPGNSWFDLQRFHMDTDSTVRLVQFANIDQIQEDAEITVHGDIIPTGGFVCAFPAGASGGATGANGSVISNGSLDFTSPLRTVDPVKIQIGYPPAVGKQATVITSLYSNAVPGTGLTGPVPVTFSITGTYTGTNIFLNHGKLEFSEQLPIRSTVSVTNLVLFGASEFDVTPASPQYEGYATVGIYPGSNAAVIKPGSGNLFAMTNIIGMTLP